VCRFFGKVEGEEKKKKGCSSSFRLAATTTTSIDSLRLSLIASDANVEPIKEILLDFLNGFPISFVDDKADCFVGGIRERNALRR